MSIHEVCKAIIEKTGIGGADHGLFHPSPETDTTTMGKWLKPERSIEYYDLQSNVRLLFCQKNKLTLL